jgi:thymidylate synthase ThyX
MGTGLEDEFVKLIFDTNRLYKELIADGFSQETAEYVLTNAYGRRVLFDANNRQVHAFSYERLNLPAQWDIRNIANKYAGLMRTINPYTCSDLCGKDQFYNVKQKSQNN